MTADQPIESYLKLTLVQGLGAVVLNRLLARFGSPDEIFGTSVGELCSVEGVSRQLARAILDAAETDVRGHLELAEDLGVNIIPITDDRYPINLRYIHDPPVLLYVKGSIRREDALAVAIVGTRRATHYGIKRAEELSGGLAAAGFCIVSGLAVGIDSAAHRAALRARGRTIAVLGCGLACIYPHRNEDLARSIVENGALVSELPLTTPPDRNNFPPRNRLISGLSLGVLAVEAPRRSGALITVRFAVEQGREVFAVPGPVDSPMTRGTHALIRDGAKLVESARDIIEGLGPLAEKITLPEEGEISDARELALTEVEALIYKTLSHQPLTLSEIIEACGLPASTVMSTLTVLQMRHLAREVSGKRFVKA